MGLFFSGDAAHLFPSSHVGRRLGQGARHWADATEEVEDRSGGHHAESCPKLSNKMQGKKSVIHCANFSHGAQMENVSTRLRDLRKSAVPRLTVRAMAAALQLPLGTYSFYESPTKFKKPTLPLELTRQIAAVLATRGVDPAEVMKLAGLTAGEAEPEARAVEAAMPQLQYVSLQVALPSEAALREMFAKMLVLVPEGASRDETAEILARWLPSGFAGIGPYLPDPGAAASPAAEAPPRSAATDDPESPRP